MDDLEHAEDLIATAGKRDGYCRPTSGWLTEGRCTSGAEGPDDEMWCGCPCGHRSSPPAESVPLGRLVPMPLLCTVVTGDGLVCFAPAGHTGDHYFHEPF